MTKEKGHGFRRIVQDRFRGLSWAGDHNYRQPQMAGRAEFGERRLAAAVLANDHIDCFLAQKLVLRFKREGAAPKDDAMARQVRRKRERLNRANKIEMLGRRREGPDLQATDRQKNAPRFAPERGGGGGHIGDITPMIARLRRPRGARQNDERNFRPRRGDGRMARYLFGERMRGVDEDIDALGFKIGLESGHAAKTADPIGNLRQAERLGAASERQYGGNAALSRKKVRELARLICPAKHENPHRSFPDLLRSSP